MTRDRKCNPGDYGNYKIDVKRGFRWTYKDGEGATSFFFEMGSGERDIVLYREFEEGVDPRFSSMAFDRVFRQLESVRYKIKILDPNDADAAAAEQYRYREQLIAESK